MDSVQQLPREFLADVENMVLEYCGDGLVAFSRCLETAWEVAPETRPSADEVSRLQKAMQQIYDAHTGRATVSLNLFRQVCLSTVLKPALNVSTPQIEPVNLPGNSSNSSSPHSGDGGEAESEEAVAARVAGLRREIKQVDRRCSQLQEELKKADLQLASCSDPAEYVSLAATARDNNDKVQALVLGVQKLESLLREARRIRAQKQAATCGLLPRGQSRFTSQAETSAAAINVMAAIAGLGPEVAVGSRDI